VDKNGINLCYLNPKYSIYVSTRDLQDEVNQGGKFVIYSYCISIIILSFKRPSSIYFVKHNQNRIAKGLPYTLISLLLGWWGIPWGIIYTIGALGSNLSGGKDVTTEVMNFVIAQSNDSIFDFEKDVTDEEAKELDVLKEGLSN
jgi:hypothetical protein